MTTFLQQLVNGLSLGSIYALIALGYTMVYGVLRLINFAHGDVYMLGAFAGYYLATALQLDGKNGTIEGIVSDVNITERGHAFINMGGVYPNHTFTAYVPAVIVPILGKDYLESLRGKDIAVTGKIKIYKGKPEIVYNKKDQVVVKGGGSEKKESAK